MRRFARPRSHSQKSRARRRSPPRQSQRQQQKPTVRQQSEREGRGIHQWLREWQPAQVATLFQFPVKTGAAAFAVLPHFIQEFRVLGAYSLGKRARIGRNASFEGGGEPGWDRTIDTLIKSQAQGAQVSEKQATPLYMPFLLLLRKPAVACRFVQRRKESSR